MTTMHTAPRVLDFLFPRFTQRRVSFTGTPVKTIAPAGWMERLADWAERQPVHHHIGSHERLR